MSLKLDAEIEDKGTRFRIFPQPQYLKGFNEPEVVVINVPPHDMKKGPACDRIYAIDPINKLIPYEYPYLPPYEGPKNPPVEADAETGHFDSLDLNSRQFKVAHMYAITRRALDIWQDYFHRKIEWIFRLHYEKLELIPLLNWDNAHSGYGFLEFGYGRYKNGSINLDRPYCMNFDVIVHELVHNLLFSEIGIPENYSSTDEFWGFHEASADLGSIIVALHSDKVVDHLLKFSSGNLFSFNELARVGELDKNRHIRNAFNWERMSTVTTESHDLSKPLTGAIFDIFVEVFQKELVNDNLITENLAERSYHGPEVDIREVQIIENEFKNAYNGKENEFKAALFRARDYLGQLLAILWDRISPHYLHYINVSNELLTIDEEITNGENEEIIIDCFVWREINFSPDSPALKTHKVRDYFADEEI